MKKKLQLLASFVLVAAIAVGATLAFLQADFGSKTNTFTSDQDIAGDLSEPAWTEADDVTPGDDGEFIWEGYLPNEIHGKDPKVTINQGSVNAYAAIKVTFLNNDGNEIDRATFESTYAKILDLDTTNWEVISDEGDTLVYMYKTILDASSANAQTTPLFTQVQVNKDIALVGEAGAETLPSFNIVVHGYAVQADEITADEAKTELLNLAQ